MVKASELKPGHIVSHTDRPAYDMHYYYGTVDTVEQTDEIDSMGFSLIRITFVERYATPVMFRAFDRVFLA